MEAGGGGGEKVQQQKGRVKLDWKEMDFSVKPKSYYPTEYVMTMTAIELISQREKEKNISMLPFLTKE